LATTLLTDDLHPPRAETSSQDRKPA